MNQKIRIRSDWGAQNENFLGDFFQYLNFINF